MQIVIREDDAVLKIDTVSIGSTAGVVTASPFGSSTDNSLATWSGTTGLILHSDRTVTLTTSAFIVPSTVTAQFLGAGANSTRIGSGSVCTSTAGVSIGLNTSVTSSDANGVCIGAGASLTALGPSCAIGSGALASDRGIAFGPASQALNGGLALGGPSHAENFSIAIGSSATTATFSFSVALGAGATATGNNQFQIGTLATPLAMHAYSGLGVFGHTPPLVQPAAIPDASGGGNIDTEARAAVNAVLAALRGTGLINT